MIHIDHILIDGAWEKAASDNVIEVVDPATEQVIATVPAATAADADRALQAARRAYSVWSTTSPAKRADHLDALCAGLEARAEELTTTIMSELGMPRQLVSAMQVNLALTESRHHAELARKLRWEEQIGNSVIVKEPVGVVVAITPWNYPLVQIMRKVAPAIVAGCTVVLKPSEVTPLNAMILAEVALESGLPSGVLNVVTGYGDEVGEALVSHAETDMISLTGSTAAGRRVSELASRSIKRVSLELGGKSPMIVLDDADMDAAIAATLNWTYLNSGQTCSALTRLLVPRERLSEAEDAALAASRNVRVGAPEDEGVTVGPLVSGVQRDRVCDYIQAGVDEGATLILDGREGLPHRAGYYVGPTVFSNVKPGMKIEQEEIFGPVLSIIAYDSEDEAVEIANNSIYGLAAAVSTRDDGRARKIALRLRAGQIEINGGAFNPFAPFGGFKQSGRGRENGHFALEEFLEVKSLQL